VHIANPIFVIKYSADGLCYQVDRLAQRSHLELVRRWTQVELLDEYASTRLVASMTTELLPQQDHTKRGFVDDNCKRIARVDV
jgi:hypothetical protein